MFLSNFLSKKSKYYKWTKKNTNHQPTKQKLSINSQVTCASLICLKNANLSQPESQQTKRHFIAKWERSNSRPYSSASPTVWANTCRTNDQSKIISICYALSSPPVSGSLFLHNSTASLLYPTLPSSLHITNYSVSAKGTLAQAWAWVLCTYSCPVD